MSGHLTRGEQTLYTLLAAHTELPDTVRPDDLAEWVHGEAPPEKPGVYQVLVSFGDRTPKPMFAKFDDRGWYFGRGSVRTAYEEDKLRFAGFPLVAWRGLKTEKQA